MHRATSPASQPSIEPFVRESRSKTSLTFEPCHYIGYQIIKKVWNNIAHHWQQILQISKEKCLCQCSTNITGDISDMCKNKSLIYFVTTDSLNRLLCRAAISLNKSYMLLRSKPPSAVFDFSTLLFNFPRSFLCFGCDSRASQLPL